MQSMIQRVQCAGNSEFSDAVSEGERADEASSLQPDADEQGEPLCRLRLHRMPGRMILSFYDYCASEGYARQASSTAMAATAKAVAKLKLQQEQGPGPGSTIAARAAVCNGSGSSQAASESEVEGDAPGATLLHPADSGYFADTEDGLALKRAPAPSNGLRTASLRSRSRQ